MYIYAYAYATVHIWRSEVNLVPSSLPFHHVGPKDGTYTVRLAANSFTSVVLITWGHDPFGDHISNILNIRYLYYNF